MPSAKVRNANHRRRSRRRTRPYKFRTQTRRRTRNQKFQNQKRIRLASLFRAFCLSRNEPKKTCLALECPVCFELFNERKLCPRVLLCGHTFCSSCLLLLLADDSVTCPTCRQTTAAATGVAGLSKNFALLGVSPAEAP